MSRRPTTKLGRNDKCWCGSGRKYKRCHLNRGSQPKPEMQEVLERFTKIYDQGRCLHPNAGTQACSGEFISAHTIQRSGGLSLVAREGHVYNVLKHGKLMDGSRWDLDGPPAKVGIKQASTFRGFCSRHDNELFSPIEKEPFEGTVEQVALLGYRAICYELFMKECMLKVDSATREMDKGEPIGFQEILQEALSIRDSGARKAVEELQDIKRHYDEVISQRRFTELGYYLVTFGSTPDVMCSGVAQVTHDFRGCEIARLGNLKVPANWLTFSLVATDEGGAAVFSWPQNHTKSEWVLRTLEELSDEDLPHAIIRFGFEYFENTYFNPNWWDALYRGTQTILRKRQLREIIGPLGERDFPRPDACLSDDGVRAVDWPGIRRKASFDCE